ncbi:MAG: hypothetical protein PUB66_10170 [Oscillospiraceae bacterium]|nr:hypothetical protein [Oscillospiraceae bacterium]
MKDKQKQTVLQSMEGDITTSLLPVQEHYTTALPFITIPGEDSAYALQVAPNRDSATLPQGIENLEGKRVIDIPMFESMTHYLVSLEGADKRLTLYSFLNDLLRPGQAFWYRGLSGTEPHHQSSGLRFYGVHILGA